jgi:sterol desaturase/sphingolipid hydroxylase (fatty acid hydroxylase superfamily)
MGPSAAKRQDPTVLAIPFYFGSMAVEYLWLRRQAPRRPELAGYERRDTAASLGMGAASLVAPLVLPRLLEPFRPGRGRIGRVLVASVVGAAGVTTVADRVARRAPPSHGPDAVDPDADPEVDRHNGDGVGRSAPTRADQVAAIGGVATVALGAVAVSTAWASLTSPQRMWRRRLLPDLGSGPWALALAVVGWDFIYYWNHRLMHEVRYLWAVHVVHHSSEHYNLSTALRQPVADSVSVSLPYGVLCLAGVSPGLVAAARGINLLYQFWIHTEAIGRLGPPEAVLNTASHHRVHHGSNSEYLDRNHGSILIVWDRLFGTFEREERAPVYGITKNIDSFNPARIASHEYLDMMADVSRSRGWGERLSHVARGPGWAPSRPRRAAAASAG